MCTHFSIPETGLNALLRRPQPDIISAMLDRHLRAVSIIAISAAAFAAAASMREENDAGCAGRHEQIAVQRDGADSDLNQSLVKKRHRSVLCGRTVADLDPPAGTVFLFRRVHRDLQDAIVERCIAVLA